MDSHDTNQPLPKNQLEEVKQPLEVEEATPTAEENVAQTQAEEAPAVPEEKPQPEEAAQAVGEVTADTETAEATAEPEATDNETQAEAEAEKTESKPKMKTKEEVLERLKEILPAAETASKHEIDALKQLFYKLHNIKLEADKKAFIEAGGQEADFFPTPDELEVAFKSILAQVKEKRGKHAAEQEKERESNLLIKQSIIEKIKGMLESVEDPNKSYNEFRKLQQQWREIKAVPQNQVNELWKSYQHYTEQFYDKLKLNNEFRDYDFKKNLEIKNRLIEAIEQLAEDDKDPVASYRQLQNLRTEFRETGPVPRDLRDKIWERYKAASNIITRRHQKHFEKLRENEQLNYDQKTVICEIVEAFDYNEFKTYADWNRKVEEITALRTKWRAIGHVPIKLNAALTERFKKACDGFFEKRNAAFHAIKSEQAGNLQKKKELCEKAEALKDSTDWKATAEILTNLQKEWKTVGPIPRKNTDAIWKRFIAACDFFFEQKNKSTSSQKSFEQDNLKKKESILEQLEAIDESMEAEEAEELMRELMKEWATIGHVPIKEKDKIRKQYTKCIDQLFKRFNVHVSQKRLNNYKTSISNYSEERGGSNALYGEREKLQRTRDNIKNELKTYENNIGFLNASSKKAGSLLTEVNRKMEKLKSELDLVMEKIKVIDESIKAQQTAE